MYYHKQKSPLHLLLHMAALATAVLYACMPANATGTAAMLLLTSLLVFLGFCFRELTVSVNQTELSIQFGPIPLFGKRILLADISHVEAARSSWIDGWGIHFVPGRGWTYSLWGFDCVEFKLSGRRFRVGTDDREGLAQALANRIVRAQGTNADARSR